jgi:hypothetical protein
VVRTLNEAGTPGTTSFAAGGRGMMVVVVVVVVVVAVMVGQNPNCQLCY